MKNILLLAVSFVALSAAANIVGTDFYTVHLEADTKEQLLIKIEQTIPLIRTGQIQSAFQSNCLQNTNNAIKVTTVSMDEIFRVDAYGALTPSYTGAINYQRDSCREPNKKR